MRRLARHCGKPPLAHLVAAAAAAVLLGSSADRGGVDGGAEEAFAARGSPHDALVRQPRWRLEVLPLPRGSSESEAVAINEAGHIVGRADTKKLLGPERSPSHAVLWRRARAIDLGTLPLGGGLDMPNASVATGINDRGEVIGDSWVESNDPTLVGFVWRSGVMTRLPFERTIDVANDGRIVGNAGRRAFAWKGGRVTGLGSGTSAAAVNGRGQVVGARRDHAFLWQGGRLRDLGTLGGASSSARAINERGQVVGTSTTSSGDAHAFLWVDGRLRDLGVLPGMRISEPIDINERGEVLCVTFASYDAAVGGKRRAFVWRDGRRRDLGTLGGRWTDASAINDSGQVVGTSTTTRGRWRPYLWRDGRMTALPLPAGWTGAPAAIDNRGRVAGGASRGDATRAILWTPLRTG